MTKDWVSVKFGRDVAGIIYFYVWKSLMNAVNTHYRDICRFHGHRVTIDSLTYQWRIFCDPCEFIFRATDTNKVAKLPKNYYSIKELY